jgi:AcrR family transcriptional regulator
MNPGFTFLVARYTKLNPIFRLREDAQTVRVDARRNRERIVSSALALFAERGPNVCMEDVARAAGLGVGTLYRHFPDRKALVLDISAGALHDLLAFGRVTLGAEHSAWEALVKIIRYCADLPLALAKSLAKSLLAESGLSALESEADDLFAQLVIRAQQEGTLRVDIPPVEVVSLLAVVVCRPGARADDHLTTVMLDGLRRTGV